MPAARVFAPGGAVVMLAAGLAPGTYLVGSLALVAVTAVLGWGAWRLRQALLPEWSGPPARLAEVVIAVAVPVGVAQLLGSFGAFRRGPVFAGCVTAGLVMGLAGRRAAGLGARSSPAEPVAGPSDTTVRSPREEVVVAAGAAALVSAQWATHVAATFGRGMTHPDTLWYHAPYAARFVQTGDLFDLPDRADAIQAYFTLNSQLVHALAILPFGHDILSPLVNVGWAALALLAVWCIGRRRGVGALCVLGAVTVLGLPTVAGTQPGQAGNDVVTGALFLAAIALLLEGELAPTPTVLAAVAAGLALGTKLTVLAPLAVVTIGVVVLCLRARRPVVAALWCGVMALWGCYWLVRNWVVAENPLPWFDLGPLSLPVRIENYGGSVADQFFDGFVWRRFYLPGLSDALGRAWPLVLGLALTGAVLAVVRGRAPLERFVGVAVPVGIVAYVFTPLTADGGGLSFVYTLRYLTPVLLAGFALLALALDGAGASWRRAMWLTLAGLVVFHTTARHYERVAAWPSGQWVPGVVVGLGVVGLAWLLAMPRSRRQTTGVALAAGALLAGSWAGGWIVQRHYLAVRYADAGLPLDRVHELFRDVRDQKVAVFGSYELYPMFGTDLSNRVSRVEGPGGDTDAELCRGWRRTLAADRYRYLVVTRQELSFDIPPGRFISPDPATEVLLRDGVSAVYRIDDTFDPDGCS